MNLLSYLLSENFLGNICIVTNILLYLSGVQVMKSIITKGSTHGISILPFLTCAVSCTVWLKYALIQDDHVLFTTNAVGTVIEWIYVLFYLSYLPTDISQNASIRRWLTIQLTFMFIVLLIASLPKYTEVEMENLREFLVKICVFTNIANYMSPLGQAIACYKNKSTENMSFALNLAYFLQVASWLIYGFVTMKAVVIIPNVFGIFLTTFTLSLFFKFPNRRRLSMMTNSSTKNLLDERPHII